MYGSLARYRHGACILATRKRGGRKPKLNAKAIRWTYKTVTEKNPLQLKFTFALWTAKMIGQLIYSKFKVNLSKGFICCLLVQLRLTPQRPVWRAYQQRPEEVQKWLQDEYPRFRRLAKQKNVLIFFRHGAGARSDHHAGTTCPVKGKTPMVSSSGAKFCLNLISAMSAQGEFRFMTFKGRVGAPQFIEFIKQLLHNMTRMVFLIVDGHPAQKPKIIKRLTESVKDRFRLFLLPPYSPELNPDERVWNDLKNNAVRRHSISSPDQLKGSILSHFRLVQKSLDRVRSYFQSETARYAA